MRVSLDFIPVPTTPRQRVEPIAAKAPCQSGAGPHRARIVKHNQKRRAKNDEHEDEKWVLRVRLHLMPGSCPETWLRPCVLRWCVFFRARNTDSFVLHCTTVALATYAYPLTFRLAKFACAVGSGRAYVRVGTETQSMYAGAAAMMRQADYMQLQSKCAIRFFVAWPRGDISLCSMIEGSALQSQGSTLRGTKRNVQTF